MDDDASLVRRTVAGDTAAFGDLYDRYAGVIRATCFDATHELNSAQDLAQEVFLRAYAKLSKLRQADRFGLWLMAISRYVCQEWRRSRRRDRHKYTAEPPETTEKTQHDSVDSINELRLSIAKLPERERLALHLLYLQREPADVARDILGLSNSAFYKLVAKARERLAEMLSNERETIR